MPVTVDGNVLRLDITMDEAFLVEESHGDQDLYGIKLCATVGEPGGVMTGAAVLSR
jgi:hypothetical protein